MVRQFLAISAVLIALGTIAAAYTQASAMNLRSEQQPLYWPRYGTVMSGHYYSGSWQPLPTRSSYTTFRGGGPGAGK